MTDTVKGPRMSRSFRRPLVLAVVPVAALSVLLGLSAVDAAGAATLGSVDVTTPGTNTSAVTLATSGTCPAPATAVQARITGSGFPPDTGQSLTSVTYTETLGTSATGGYILPVSQTLADYANMQNPAAVYSGAYTITVKCRTNTSGTSLGDFTGVITFSSPTAYTQTSASASPTPSASGSPSPSASASPSGTASPSASASAKPSVSASASASPSVSKTPTASPTVTQTSTGGTLMATDATGAPLPANPVLATGQAVTVTASGFVADERVTVSVHSVTRQLGTATAGSGGILRYPFKVPSNLAAGGHTLTLAGSAHTSLFAFRIGAATTPVTVTGSGTGASTSGHLPMTGSNTVRLLLLALALVWAGAMMVLYLGPASSGTGRHAVAGRRGRHSR